MGVLKVEIDLIGARGLITINPVSSGEVNPDLLVAIGAGEAKFTEVTTGVVAA